jgi:putative aldouronate transport system permease protein
MKERLHTLSRKIWEARYIYLLLIPGILYFAIFHYGPMGGLVLAFKKYNARLGIFGSQWVWLDNFIRIFVTSGAVQGIRNTFVINFSRLLIEFPVPILLALLRPQSIRRGCRCRGR